MHTNMKKIFFYIVLIVFSMPVFANDTSLIEDEILKSPHFHKKIKPYKIQDKTPITDELINSQTENNSSVFKLEVSRQGQYTTIPIEDELLSPEFIQNASNLIIVGKEKPDDLFIEKNIDLTKVRHIKAKTKYDFTKKQIPVHIRISKYLTSKNGSIEGDTVPFETTKDFEINGKTFKKGTPVLGRIETISNSDKMGVPECIKIDNFYIKDEQEIDLHGSISKIGANRSIWVYPLYQAGNICFYVAGFVFVPIHGGRAKFSTEETFTVYYETK